MPKGDIYLPTLSGAIKSEELEDMLKIPKANENDPMNIPANFRYICEELDKKGGIRIDNCNEIEIIKSAVYNQYQDESLKKSVYQLIDLMVNLSNMWLIHFSKHKETYNYTS